MSKASNLKYLRKGKKLSQQQLADALCVTKSTVVAWEKLKHAITEPNARRIAEYFDVSYDDFCLSDFEKLDREIMADELTHEEIQNVYRFRQLSDTSKGIIRSAIRTALELEKGEST